MNLHEIVIALSGVTITLTMTQAAKQAVRSIEQHKGEYPLLGRMFGTGEGSTSFGLLESPEHK